MGFLLQASLAGAALPCSRPYVCAPAIAAGGLAELEDCTL